MTVLKLTERQTEKCLLKEINETQTQTQTHLHQNGIQTDKLKM